MQKIEIDQPILTVGPSFDEVLIALKTGMSTIFEEADGGFVTLSLSAVRVVDRKAGSFEIEAQIIPGLRAIICGTWNCEGHYITTFKSGHYRIIKS